MTRTMTSLLMDPRVSDSVRSTSFRIPWDIERLVTPYTRDLLWINHLNLIGFVDYALSLLPLVEEVGDPDDVAMVLSKLEQDYPEFIDGTGVDGPDDWTALETVAEDLLRVVRLVERYFPPRLAGFGHNRQQMYTRRIEPRSLCIVTSHA